MVALHSNGPWPAGTVLGRGCRDPGAWATTGNQRGPQASRAVITQRASSWLSDGRLRLILFPAIGMAPPRQTCCQHGNGRLLFEKGRKWKRRGARSGRFAQVQRPPILDHQARTPVILPVVAANGALLSETLRQPASRLHGRVAAAAAVERARQQLGFLFGGGGLSRWCSPAAPPNANNLALQGAGQAR